ncbi:MAG: hypothetical protein QXV40_01485 [Thermoplasmatales archaeon]
MNVKSFAIIFLLFLILIAYQLPATPASTKEGGEFPAISVDEIAFGATQFSSSEVFVTHFNELSIIESNGSTEISSWSNQSTVIGDYVNAYLSFIIPSHNLIIPAGQGGNNIVFYSERLLILHLNISGHTSFRHLSLVEFIPAHLEIYNTTSKFYNFSLSYDNTTVSLLIPREIETKGYAFMIETNATEEGGNSTISVSLTLPSDNFSLSFNQYLYYAFPIRQDVLKYYSPLAQGTNEATPYLYLNSALIGCALFSVVIVFLYIYYRKK